MGFQEFVFAIVFIRASRDSVGHSTQSGIIQITRKDLFKRTNDTTYSSDSTDIIFNPYCLFNLEAISARKRRNQFYFYADLFGICHDFDSSFSLCKDGLFRSSE